MTAANGSTGASPDAMAGFRVLDLTTMISGPYCTRLLADAGAEVIKIEPHDGDHMRKAAPIRDGRSAYFGSLNVGKRSIVLDLKMPAATAVMRRLAAMSDVIVENYRPGVMKRLGLDHEALAKINPRLVYCSISGFGQTGPDAHRPAYAPIVHATSGYDLAQLRYQDGQDVPGKTGIFMADVLGGINAFAAIQTALLHRERSGVGQHVDVALADTMLNLLVYECQEAQFPSPTRRHLYVPICAQDGFVIVAPITTNNFHALCDAIGRRELKDDARFAIAGTRSANWDALMAIVEAWTIRRPARDCEDVLSAAGVPCGRYRTVGEAMAEPQVAVRGGFSEVDDGAGLFKVPNAPFQFSATRMAPRGGVPGLGEDGAALLTSLLGLTVEQIEALGGVAPRDDRQRP
jgi:CoA:oxalate CoA-transferase